QDPSVPRAGAVVHNPGRHRWAEQHWSDAPIRKGTAPAGSVPSEMQRSSNPSVGRYVISNPRADGSRKRRLSPRRGKLLLDLDLGPLLLQRGLDLLGLVA